MTINTASIDFMNKCLIDMSPYYSCITISKIMASLMISIGMMVIILIIFLLRIKHNKEVQEEDEIN